VSPVIRSIGFLVESDRLFGIWGRSLSVLIQLDLHFLKLDDS
jgi:hypothetical protein